MGPWGSSSHDDDDEDADEERQRRAEARAAAFVGRNGRRSTDEVSSSSLSADLRSERGGGGASSSKGLESSGGATATATTATGAAAAAADEGGGAAPSTTSPSPSPPAPPPPATANNKDPVATSFKYVPKRKERAAAAAPSPPSYPRRRQASGKLSDKFDLPALSEDEEVVVPDDGKRSSFALYKSSLTDILNKTSAYGRSGDDFRTSSSEGEDDDDGEEEEKDEEGKGGEEGDGGGRTSSARSARGLLIRGSSLTDVLNRFRFENDSSSSSEDEDDDDSAGGKKASASPPARGLSNASSSAKDDAKAKAKAKANANLNPPAAKADNIDRSSRANSKTDTAAAVAGPRLKKDGSVTFRNVQNLETGSLYSLGSATVSLKPAVAPSPNKTTSIGSDNAMDDALTSDNNSISSTGSRSASTTTKEKKEDDNGTDDSTLGNSTLGNSTITSRSSKIHTFRYHPYRPPAEQQQQQQQQPDIAHLQATAVKEEEVEAGDDQIGELLRESSDRSSVHFGSASDIRTGSIILRSADDLTPRHTFASRLATASGPSSVTVNSNATDGGSENTFKYEEEASATGSTSTMTSRPTKGVLKRSSYSPVNIQSTSAAASSLSSAKKKKIKRGGSKRLSIWNPLSARSRMFDINGDGILDEIERAMRDRDLDGDGRLDNVEVARIVRDQLRAQKDARTYRKAAAGLVCLVAVLALTNFGTSLATAILTKEIIAHDETGTVQSKARGDVMGLQDVAYTLELESLDDEEFYARRALVEAEMMSDPDHELHLHRRLGKKNKKNKMCNCSKIAYDQGKIQQHDLDNLTRRCDGANTVNIRRRWRDGFGSEYEDYDTVCGPGTIVVRKQKEKNNRHKTKVKVVDEQVTFRKKGKDGKDKSISFTCKKGRCYGSGGALIQREGHPCDIARDYDGAGECDEGLICYDPDGFTYGVGVCTRLQRYARSAQACDVDLGVDACVSGYACISTYGKKVKVGQIRTGTCQRVVSLSTDGEVCNVSFGNDACEAGYRCVGANGREIRSRVGIGYCVRSSNGGGGGGSNGWYVDYSLGSEGQCINDGRQNKWDDTWASANQCCEETLWWMKKSQCVPGYNDWS